MSASLAESLASLPEAERAEILASLTDDEAEALEYDWRFWARPKQIIPDGGWLTWLILAGRGFGKTRTGAETVRELVCGVSPLAAGQCSRIALVAETAADARDVVVEGDSGILACHPRAFRPTYEPSKRRLTWPNGAVATLYNAVEPDQLRGPQHDLAWCDELAKWRYVKDTWDQLQFGLRLGAHPRQIITTTPRPIPILKELITSASTVVTRGSTEENRNNLAPSFLQTVVSKYEGTRLGRQELNAEILDDVPGALWSRSIIDETRVRDHGPMQRIAVAVDPPITSGDDADECGIVVGGVGDDGHGYVLADRSAQGKTPAEWATIAVRTFEQFSADLIVAEANQGGEMVRAVLQQAAPNVPVVLVHATRGKYVRAEPISLLYEQRRIHHVGAFPKLEDQMCAMTPDFDPDKAGYSPDRLDALVWAMTELMTKPRHEPGVRRL